MRYGLLGAGTGLRLSKVVLGCATFGTRWGYGADAAEVTAMVEAYLGAGGNVIDTAGTYQRGESEELLGTILAPHRDEVILATKFGLGDGAGASLHSVGNSRKAMARSVETSLSRLRTDRVDLLWVHMPDGVTSTDEIMRGLDDLVRAGKVLAVGLSDFPAWRVARAATLAELRGLAPVAGIQVEYSLVERTAERELLPMAEAFAISALGWSPLAGGLLTGKYRRGEEGRATTWGQLVHAEDDERKRRTVDVLLAVAAEVGVNPGQVALSWVLAHDVMPVIGPRTLAQLQDNLGACAVSLDAAQLARLDEASAIAPGFPHALIAEWDERLTAGLADRIDRPRRPVT